MDDSEAIRVAPCELAKFAREDDRQLGAVGVDEHDVTGADGERGFQDRYHRGDAAASRPQEEIMAQVRRGEQA
jgi:hypothetical protein